MINTRSGGRPQILIVDNHTDSREALADVLDAAGYDARCAGDGAEALEHLKDGPAPFLMVVDPEAACRDIDPFWLDVRLRTVPLMVVTRLDECERCALLPGAGDCFAKPVNIPALLRAIASCLQRLSVPVPCPAPAS